LLDGKNVLIDVGPYFDVMLVEYCDGIFGLELSVISGTVVFIYDP